MDQKDKAKADPKPLKDDAPMVCIVAMGHYKHMPILKQSVANALGLAKEFDTTDFRVQFICESNSIEAAKVELAKSPRVTTVEANNDVDLEKALRTWYADVEMRKPPLAILVLSGHGEERIVDAGDNRRKTVAVFLSRDDASGQNGVIIDHISRLAAEATAVPMAIIYDACRTPAPRQITSARTCTFSAGVKSTFKITTEGDNLKIDVEKGDDLPEGITLKDNGDGTATLAGTPTKFIKENIRLRFSRSRRRPQ